MSRDIPESDWQRFRKIHSELCDEFCARVLAEAQSITTSSEGSPHKRYIRLFRLIERRDDELARGFNDLRRSTALQQLLVLRGLGLLTDDHIQSFTPETQLVLRAFDGHTKD
jgi:hypothetical protein